MKLISVKKLSGYFCGAILASRGFFLLVLLLICAQEFKYLCFLWRIVHNNVVSTDIKFLSVLIQDKRVSSKNMCYLVLCTLNLL